MDITCIPTVLLGVDFDPVRIGLISRHFISRYIVLITVAGLTRKEEALTKKKEVFAKAVNLHILVRRRYYTGCFFYCGTP